MRWPLEDDVANMAIIRIRSHQAFRSQLGSTEREALRQHLQNNQGADEPTKTPPITPHHLDGWYIPRTTEMYDFSRRTTWV